MNVVHVWVRVCACVRAYVRAHVCVWCVCMCGPLAKCPFAKCPLTKCPLAKCPLTKCPDAGVNDEMDNITSM